MPSTCTPAITIAVVGVTDACSSVEFVGVSFAVAIAAFVVVLVLGVVVPMMLVVATAAAAASACALAFVPLLVYFKGSLGCRRKAPESGTLGVACMGSGRLLVSLYPFKTSQGGISLKRAHPCCTCRIRVWPATKHGAQA